MSKHEKQKDKAKSLEARDPKGAAEAWLQVLEVQVADTVVDREIGVRVPLFVLVLENLKPRLGRPFGVPGLKALGLVLLLLMLGHGALKIWALARGDKRNRLSRRRLRGSRPSSTRLPANLTRRTRPGRHEIPARADPDRLQVPARRRRSRSRRSGLQHAASRVATRPAPSRAAGSRWATSRG